MAEAIPFQKRHAQGAISPEGTLTVHEPGSGKMLGEVRVSSAADVRETVQRARAAQSDWARKPVGDIFVDDGELVFRELERGAVARGLDAVKADGGVLALGSGAVLDPDVRRMLAGQVIIYLETEFATVAKRLGQLSQHFASLRESHRAQGASADSPGKVDGLGQFEALGGRFSDRFFVGRIDERRFFAGPAPPLCRKITLQFGSHDGRQATTPVRALRPYLSEGSSK